MKRMWSKNELQRIAEALAKSTQKDIATLVDAEGHPRFIEGDGENTEITGITYNYTKWSLSGSHLMIVLDVMIAASTSLATNDFDTLFEVPQWIYDKLYPAISSYLDAKNFDTSYNGYGLSGTQIGFYIYKDNGKLRLRNISYTASSADEHCRVVFDFLIDNE